VRFNSFIGNVALEPPFAVYNLQGCIFGLSFVFGYILGAFFCFSFITPSSNFG
jgi:hypothetical protein